MDLSLAIALGITLVIAILLIVFNDIPNEKLNYQKHLQSVSFTPDYMATITDLQHRLSILQLEKYSQLIEQRLVPMLKFDIASATGEPLKIGQSKIGGYCDSPMAKSLSNNSFLLQINCHDLYLSMDKTSFDASKNQQFFIQNELFRDGILYFFLDKDKMEKEKQNFVEVQYYPSLTDLATCKKQKTISTKDSYVIHFVSALSLPDAHTQWVRETFVNFEQEGYYKLINTENCNQISGYPQSITQYFDFNPKDKLLLLQLENIDMINQLPKWSRIYVFVDRQKAQAKDFSELTSYMQQFE